MHKVYHCSTLWKAIKLALLVEGSVIKLTKGWGVRVSPRTVTPIPLVRMAQTPTDFGYRYDVIVVPNTGIVTTN